MFVGFPRTCDCTGALSPSKTPVFITDTDHTVSTSPSGPWVQPFLEEKVAKLEKIVTVWTSDTIDLARGNQNLNRTTFKERSQVLASNLSPEQVPLSPSCPCSETLWSCRSQGFPIYMPCIWKVQGGLWDSHPSEGMQTQS